MSKIISGKDIGAYTLSIDDDGEMTIRAAHLHDPVTLNSGQALELLQWLSTQQELLQAKAVTPRVDITTPVLVEPSESSEEIVQRIINDAIVLARANYPASLDFEHRDRFIDQISRDPAVKPLVTQGQVSRKQIMLWIGQQLDTSAEPLWTQDQPKGKRFRS